MSTHEHLLNNAGNNTRNTLPSPPPVLPLNSSSATESIGSSLASGNGDVDNRPPSPASDLRTYPPVSSYTPAFLRKLFGKELIYVEECGEMSEDEFSKFVFDKVKERDDAPVEKQKRIEEARIRMREKKEIAQRARKNERRAEQGLPPIGQKRKPAVQETPEERKKRQKKEAEDSFDEAKKQLAAAAHAATAADKFALPVPEGVSGDTRVPIREGVSVLLKDLKPGQQVLGLALDNTRLVPRRVTSISSSEQAACVELCFSDGRTVVCSPTHLVKTAAGDVPAHALTVDTVVCGGLTTPQASPPPSDAEAPTQAQWLAKLTTLLRRSATQTLPQAEALARVIGLLISDGSRRKNGTTVLSIGHAMDVATVQADLRVLGFKTGNVRWHKGVYNLDFGSSVGLSKAAAALGIGAGARVGRPTSLPPIFVDSTCPVSVKREFIAGLFGGDGCAPSFNHSQTGSYKNVQLKWSKRGREAVEGQKKVYMEELVPMLVVCGIPLRERYSMPVTQSGKNTRNEAGKREVARLQAAGQTIQKTIPSEEALSSMTYSVTFALSTEDTYHFHRHVGFRHCLHKQLRLHAAALHRGAVDCVSDSTARVEALYKELKERTKKARYQSACLQAHAVKFVHTSCAAKIFGLPVGRMTCAESLDHFKTREYFSLRSGNKNYNAKSGNVPNRPNPPRKVRYATDATKNSIPPSRVTLVSKRRVGAHKLYAVTLELPEGVRHGFIANGVLCGSGVAMSEPRKSEDICAWGANYFP